MKKLIDGKPKSQSRVYRIWCSMKQRCNNPKASSYSHYGGRGIKVCPEWEHNSDNFIEWAYSHGYKNNLEIDRIDPDKGYCPENCRWITKHENAKRAQESPRTRFNEAHRRWLRYKRMGLSMKYWPEPKFENYL